MSFSMDDVMEIIKIVKECKDSELHINTGDINLSLFKGDVGDSTRGPIAFSGAAASSPQPAVEAAPAPAAAPAAEAPALIEPEPDTTWLPVEEIDASALSAASPL